MAEPNPFDPEYNPQDERDLSEELRELLDWMTDVEVERWLREHRPKQAS